jgi:hypothetical protein
VHAVPGHPPLLSEIARAAASGSLRTVSVRLLPFHALSYLEPATPASARTLLSLAHLAVFQSLQGLTLGMPRKPGDDAPAFSLPPPPPAGAPLVGLQVLKLQFEMWPEIARAFRLLLPAAASLETLALEAWPPSVAPPALTGLTALVGGTRKRRCARGEVHVRALMGTFPSLRHANTANPTIARPWPAPLWPLQTGRKPRARTRDAPSCGLPPCPKSGPRAAAAGAPGIQRHG